MLCNIFMLYHEAEGTAGAVPKIHTDEFMMIFPAALMIQRPGKVQHEVTSAELNEQVRAVRHYTHKQLKKEPVVINAQGHRPPNWSVRFFAAKLPWCVCSVVWLTLKVCVYVRVFGNAFVRSLSRTAVIPHAHAGVAAPEQDEGTAKSIVEYVSNDGNVHG